jgi:hypothetical protein
MKVPGKIAAGYDSSDAAAANVQRRVNAAIARRKTNLDASTGLEEPVSLAAKSCCIHHFRTSTCPPQPLGHLSARTEPLMARVPTPAKPPLSNAYEQPSHKLTPTALRSAPPLTRTASANPNATRIPVTAK